MLKAPPQADRILALAIDTIGGNCAVSLVAYQGDFLNLKPKNFITLQSSIEVMERGQAEAIIPMIESLMAKAQTAFHAIDLIAVNVGPGSFTGIRVGIAAASGLALALNIPIIGVNAIEAYLDQGSENQNLEMQRPQHQGLVLIDSGRGDVFVGFDAKHIQICNKDKLAELVKDYLKNHINKDLVLKLFGDAIPSCYPLLIGAGINLADNANYQPLHPQILAKLAIYDYITLLGDQAFPLKPNAFPKVSPLYLREASTSPPSRDKAAAPNFNQV